MPCSIRVDPSTGIATAELTGDFTPEEIAAAFRKAWEDPSWGSKVVLDVRGGFPAGWGTRDTRTVIGLLARDRPTRLPVGRWVLLVASDLDYGLSRVFEALAYELPVEYRVTRDPRTALRWLLGEGSDEAFERLPEGGGGAGSSGRPG